MATVLLIEDDPNQRLLYRLELEEEGYDVIEAPSGQEGLWKVEKGRPDVVVLDLWMRSANGVEILWQIKGQNARMPVIINSGYESFKDDFMTWAADAYPIKSSNLDPLKSQIRRSLLAKEDKEERNGGCMRDAGLTPVFVASRRFPGPGLDRPGETREI